MQIAILIFDKITALDAIGPYEVLRNVPGWEVKFVGPQKGPVRADSGALGLSVDHALEERLCFVLLTASVQKAYARQ